MFLYKIKKFKGLKNLTSVLRQAIAHTIEDSCSCNTLYASFAAACFAAAREFPVPFPYT